MKSSDRIYIAGHKGLVGSAVLKKLDEKGYSNLTYRTKRELDLRRQSETERYFEEERPEYVFLAAAKVGGILANNTYKAEFIYDNITIAANVINSAYKAGVKKLLNLGSSCIYPRSASQPIKEEYLLTGYLEPTNEAYAIAKISAIKLCRYYNEQYGTNFISVMPTNLYGPRDNFNLETAHVPPALMRKFHLAKLLRNRDFEGIKKDIAMYPLNSRTEMIDLESEGSLRQALREVGLTESSVTLWGSGEPYREFLYIDDLVDACIFLMEGFDFKDLGDFVNIGSGQDIKIKDFAEIIKKVVGYDGGISYDRSKPDGMPRKLLDVSRMKKLGWEPRVSLEEGIRKTYEWYLQEHAAMDGLRS